MTRRSVLPCLAAALLAGCTSVKITENFGDVKVEAGAEPLAAVEIENSSWLLLDFIPIASGDPEHPNRNCCRWFRNTATLETNVKLLGAEMKRRGATRCANVTSRWTDEKALVILLARRAYHTSAVILKDPK